MGDTITHAIEDKMCEALGAKSSRGNAPEAMLMAKNFQKSVLGLALGNMFLMVSLKAKLKACVGKYRMTLARLPRQKEATPCSAATREKQLLMPAQNMQNRL